MAGTSSSEAGAAVRGTAGIGAEGARIGEA